MSILRRQRATEARAHDASSLIGAMRAHRVDGSAARVETDRALQVPAVAACVQTVAGAISSLTIEGYREVKGGMPLPIDSLPRLWREPSALESPEDWFYKVIQAAMTDGRAWGRIVSRDTRESPTQIELFPDEAVQVKTDSRTRERTYLFDRVEVPADDVWWMTGIPSRRDEYGVSLVQRASEPISVQLAALAYLRHWFVDGAHPTSVIQTETDLGQEQAESVKRRIRDLTSGSREPLVLPKSVTLNPFQTAPADSAIGDVLMTTSTQIATFFLIPPEMAGGSTGESLTYNTVDGQQIMVLQRAVRFWMRKLELSLSRAVRPASIYAKFDENDLVRTDLKTKFDAIIAATGGPFLTINEGREMDDRAPTGDGDVIRTPKQQPAVREVVRSTERADLETLAVMMGNRGGDTHLHLPESLELKQQPPVVHVRVDPTPVDVRFDAPPTPAPIVNVNVEPTPVTVNVEAAPTPNVTVEPAPITVLPPAPTGGDITFVRDSQGRITGAHKEP